MTVSRRSTRQRKTAETSIDLTLDLDGSGTTDVSTGIPFYDHMLSQVGKHGGFDLTIRAVGDVHIDTHHTVEDVAIAFGEALRDALGDKAGVRRFASGLFPLDEALCEIALDLSGCRDPGVLAARRTGFRSATRRTRREFTGHGRRCHAARDLEARSQRSSHRRVRVQGSRPLSA